MMHRFRVDIDIETTNPDDVFDDLEAARIEHEGITIKTAGGSYPAEVVRVKEL